MTTAGEPMTLTPARARSIFDRRHLALTTGVLTLVALGALENRAALSILPTVAADLDGMAWYGAATAAGAAVLAVATVVAGGLVDRRGVRLVLGAGVALFVLAQVVSAAAPDMAVFVVGRSVSGAAEGAVDVSLTVLVAQAYAEELRPRVFAWFAAAWVVPSLVGPALTGLAADLAGWRAAFALPVLGVLPALLLVAPTLRTLRVLGAPSPTPQRLGPALAVGGALLVLSLAAPLLRSHPSAGWLLLAGGLVGLGVAAYRLLPAGTFLARPGLPALVALRLLVSVAFPGVGTFLPLLLATRGAGPALAGASLSVTGVFWAAGSWVNSLPAVQRHSDVSLRSAVAFVALTLGALGPVLLALDSVGTVAGLAGWALCGFGIGLLTPTLTVAALDLASEETRGEASADQTLAVSIGFALPTALGGVVVATHADHLTGGVFALVMGAAAGVAALGVLASRRAR